MYIRTSILASLVCILLNEHFILLQLLTELELMKWTDLVAANEDGESDSKTLLPSMFAQLFIESLVFGNVDKEQALALVHIVTDAFEDTYNTSPIAASTHSSDSASDSDSDSGNFPTTTHVVKIPAAENVVAQSRTLNQDNTNSATLLAFQTGKHRYTIVPVHAPISIHPIDVQLQADTRALTYTRAFIHSRIHRCEQQSSQHCAGRATGLHDPRALLQPAEDQGAAGLCGVLLGSLCLRSHFP